MDKTDELQNLSKYHEIDNSLRQVDWACSMLEDALDSLQGNPNSNDVESKPSDKSFIEVYISIADRAYRAADRIRTATNIMKEMLT